MRRAFVAIWYDRDKVHDRARAAGWKDGEDGLLDTYAPEEDPNGHEAQEFLDLDSAENHLCKIINAGQEFWGSATIREFEVLNRSQCCRYCICRGWKCIREHTVDDTGIVEVHTRDDCYDED